MVYKPTKLKRIMKPIAISIFVVGMAIASQAQLQSLVVDGNTREYEVNLPQNFEAGDTAGFIMVYPRGIDESWNIGMEYCPFRSPFPGIALVRVQQDDVVYVDKVAVK